MSEMRHIGKDIPRLGARDIITGRAKYAQDIHLPRMLYAKVLRSPYTGQKDQFWIKALVFSTVTAIVGIVNYPRTMNHALDCDMDIPENRRNLKMHMKNYLLTSIQAMLRERGIE